MDFDFTRLKAVLENRAHDRCIKEMFDFANERIKFYQKEVEKYEQKFFNTQDMSFDSYVDYQSPSYMCHQYVEFLKFLAENLKECHPEVEETEQKDDKKDTKIDPEASNDPQNC
jgi:hypothetical protein